MAAFIHLSSLLMAGFGEDHIHNTSHADNCTDGVQWIWVGLHDCVRDWKGYVSTLMGLASMLTWMLVALPQFVKNCRNLDGMVGVSLMLILQWMAGDITNLIGSVLTKQLIVQVLVGGWFVVNDTMLLSQYLAFICKQHRKKKEALLPQQEKGFRPNGQVMLGLCLMLGLGCFHLWSVQGPVELASAPHRRMGRHLLALEDDGEITQIFYGNVDIIGYAIGVVSSLFYIGSRLSQIYKNYKLQSTEGLSIFMFVLAVLGNLFYGLAILFREITVVYVIRHLPWLVGSLGVIFLDCTLLLQFRCYRDTMAEERQKLLETQVTVEPDYGTCQNQHSVPEVAVHNPVHIQM